MSWRHIPHPPGPRAPHRRGPDSVFGHTLAEVRTATDPRELIAAVTHEVRGGTERRSAQGVDTCRDALSVTSARLAELRAPGADIDVENATDMLWFLLDDRSSRLFVRDQGWSWGDTEAWLAQQASTALLPAPESR